MMLLYFVLHDFGQRWLKLFLSYSNIAQNKITTHTSVESSTMKNTVKKCWNISY